MRFAKPRWWAAIGAVAVLAVLTGCPPTARLEVLPAAVSFGADRAEVFITLRNLGKLPAAWTMEEVVRDNADAPWRAGEVAWFAADKADGTLGTELDRLTLTADRSLLTAGNYENAGIRVAGRNFSRIVPVSISVEPTLEVVPSRISLRPGTRTASFTVRNTGGSGLAWSVRFLDPGAAPEASVPLPADMTATPNPGTTAVGGQTRVELNWTVDRGDFRILVDSPGGQAVVQVVFGAALPGLEVTPENLTLYYQNSSGSAAPSQPASKLYIKNIGATARSWNLSLSDRNNPDTAPAISATPGLGSTQPGETTEVLVRVTDPAAVTAGSGNYELAVRSGADGFLLIPVTLEVVSLPVIVASEPPNPVVDRPEVAALSTLDFGRDKFVMEFWVVNTGPLSSDLFFQVTHDDQEIATPLISSVSPLRGDTNERPGQDFFLFGTNDRVDATPVYVTVDRSVMTEDVEYRTITIEAWNQDYTARVDAVEPWTIEVRVERPPLTVEGAINRSRPPFLSKFLFLLRDTRGAAIPTQTPEDLSKIDFDVAEDGIALDWNETTRNLTGPEGIKANIVLLLDYTGSMYNAGTSDTVAPLRPGEALAQVKEAALRFLDDLPASHRVSLMYYNDRQQLNRVIFPFSTDRGALKAALRDFRISPAFHGTSAIWDAVVEAVQRLAAEDPPETLPFDDADMRAVIFITDGQDNSSVSDAGAAASTAKDNRVRLYPLGYAPKSPLNTAALIEAANTTGGHYYGAGDVRNLTALLGNRRSLVLEPAESVLPEEVSFNIVNAGGAPLAWNAALAEARPWITSVVPDSGIAPVGGSSRVTVTVNPAAAGAPPLNNVRAVLNITSGDGQGTATVRMFLGPDDVTLQDLSVTLDDEPGLVWSELRNQVVLSYVTPRQSAGNYTIRVNYTQPNGDVITGFFQEDGLFFPGDVRAGQLSMTTSGITLDPDAATVDEAVRAEAFLRADYVPRGVSQFRVRFVPQLPVDAPPAAVAAFAASFSLDAELAPDGLLVSTDAFTPAWRLVKGQDHVYTMLTEQSNYLPYGVSGNLLRLRLTGLKGYVDACNAAGVDPRVLLDMRVENQIYVRPAGPGRPSETVFFLYPSGPAAPDRPLVVGEVSDTAAAARTILDLVTFSINPEASGAWDRDEDGLPDFQDPAPDNPSLPGLLTFPSQVNVTLGPATVTVTNNRLDTFEWAVAVQSAALAGRFTVDLTGAAAVLAPGESASFKISVDKTGLPSGNYEAALLLDTDAFATEQTKVVFSVS